MALTDTKKAKEFVAGAPKIILKGDLRPNQMMASDPSPMDDLNQLSLMLYKKPLSDLTDDEYESLQEAARDNLAEGTKPNQMMASAPDIMDDLNQLSLMLYKKPLSDLTDDEYDRLQEAARDKLAVGGRAQYGLGSLVKSVKKAVKGVVSGVKDNPLLAAAALNFAPMLGGGQPFFGLGGLQGSVKTFANPLSFLNLSDKVSKTDKAMDALKVGGAGAAITGLLSQKEELNTGDPDDAKRRANVIEQLKVQFSRLYPKGENESPEDYDVRITAMVDAADDSTIPVGNMAEGGRIGYAGGSYKDRIQDMADEIAQDDYGQDFYDLGKKLQDKVYERAMRKISDAFADKADMMRKNEAEGGRIGYAMGDSASENAMQAAGIEGLPLRENSKGVKEVDLRKTGGFIPPVGVKEKADDIPAMLSNNEFVFTADAVRAAGGGSVNKGAQRMYDLMKSLESKVV